VQVDTVLKYSAYLTAKSAFDKANRDVERLTQLRKENNAAESELENAQLQEQNAKAQFIAAERQLRDARVTSPIAGTIIERPVQAGSMLAPGMPVATVVDVAMLKLRANLPEEEILKLRTGDRVAVRVDVYPEAKFTGTVAFISTKGSDAHSYPVEIAVPNNGQFPVKAGMTARFSRTSTEARQSLVIPRLAVVGSMKSPQVYVVENVNGKQIVKLRELALGTEHGMKIEVLSGLQAGERVVVNGQQNVRAGTEVAETAEAAAVRVQ
jgi:RND family efflux transporter MFP subunit